MKNSNQFSHIFIYVGKSLLLFRLFQHWVCICICISSKVLLSILPLLNLFNLFVFFRNELNCDSFSIWFVSWHDVGDFDRKHTNLYNSIKFKAYSMPLQSISSFDSRTIYN